MFVLPHLALCQYAVEAERPVNAILITPLGDALNNSKSSIYYRRVLKTNGNKYLGLRVGTELLNGIRNTFTSEVEERSSALNLKAGLEMGKEINRLELYLVPEISYTRASISNATLIPGETALFSTRSINAAALSAIDETKLSLFSLIGCIGFKYKLTNSLLLGVESAIGLGWYSSTEQYDSRFFEDKQRTGAIRDLAVNRFILLEYRF